MVPVLVGTAYGYLSRMQSPARFALVSVCVSGGLFLLVLLLGIASLVLSPDTFDDHAAAIDLMAGIPGAILLFLLLWLGALGGAALRRRLSRVLGT